MPGLSKGVFMKYLGFALAILMLFTVGLLIFLVLTMVNSIGLSSSNTVNAIVEDKEAILTHTTTRFVPIGKGGLMPIAESVPETYKIRFKIRDSEVSMNVEKDFFDVAKIGDEIEVDYGIGRVSKSYYPLKVRLFER